MVGILLVSHYTLGECLKDTVALIIGQRDNVEALALNKNDKVEVFSEKLKKAVEKLDKGDGVIIFTDMFGGTPCNASLALFGQDDRVRIIAGFNMPVVIEGIMHAGKPIDEVVRGIMDRREKTIVDAKAIFKSQKK
jgi:PTS system mannose-specific IIA component